MCAGDMRTVTLEERGADKSGGVNGDGGDDDASHAKPDVPMHERERRDVDVKYGADVLPAASIEGGGDRRRRAGGVEGRDDNRDDVPPPMASGLVAMGEPLPLPESSRATEGGGVDAGLSAVTTVVMGSGVVMVEVVVVVVEAIEQRSSSARGEGSRRGMRDTGTEREDTAWQKDVCGTEATKAMSRRCESSRYWWPSNGWRGSGCIWHPLLLDSALSGRDPPLPAW
jgi:hypothetical protein